ncbi:hypothetical protein MRX96_056754 [Rhipicephalus microplus]
MMFNSEMFEGLKREQPDALKKVTALEGDLTQPNLGLSLSDQALLTDDVSVVFHSGATVKFDEPIRKAVELNVFGTTRVLDLCKRMPKLCALAHVSTAYCNCDKPDVQEGWIDNYNGCTGVVITLGLGILQSILTEKRCTADLVPVDVVAKMLICVAWHASSKRFVRRYEKVGKAVRAVEYFTTNGWLFRTNNVQKLLRELSRTDAKLFNFDVQAIEWSQYWQNYILGIRKYLLKVEESKKPDARKHLARLYVMHLVFQALLLMFVWWLLRTSTAWNLYSFVVISAKTTCQMLLHLLDMLPK